MAQELSFAQALTEAKQIIVQQASRIKADADKVKVQQEMLLSQGSTIGEQEKQMKDQSQEIERLLSQVADLSHKLEQQTTAKEQAEAVINRQGERITSLQHTLSDYEKRMSLQSEQISDLARERETLVEKLPTREDEEALAAMSALLMKKVTTGPGMPMKPQQQMRLAEAA